MTGKRKAAFSDRSWRVLEGKAGKNGTQRVKSTWPTVFLQFSGKTSGVRTDPIVLGLMTLPGTISSRRRPVGEGRRGVCLIEF